MRYLIITIACFLLINEGYGQLNYASDIKALKKQVKKSEKLEVNESFDVDSVIFALIDELTMVTISDLIKQTVVKDDSVHLIDSSNFQAFESFMLKIYFVDESYITLTDYEAIDIDKKQSETFELLYMMLHHRIKSCSCMPKEFINSFGVLFNVALDDGEKLVVNYDFVFDIKSTGYLIKERKINYQ